MTKLLKTESVLDLRSIGKKHVSYGREEVDRDHRFQLPKELWIDLGYPNQVTIAVSGGDKLNS